MNFYKARRTKNGNIIRTLSLNAIYTLYSATAEELLIELAQQSKDVQVAIVAFLLAATPYERQYNYGEIALIKDYGCDYVIKLNNEG